MSRPSFLFGGLAAAFQQGREVLAGEAARVGGDLLRRPLGDDLAAAHAALRLRLAFGSGPKSGEPPTEV